jgi:hypothetical protein
MDRNKVYPRSNDNQTVYLKSVITRPTIEVGDFTIYNDFVNDPRDFYNRQNEKYIFAKRKVHFLRFFGDLVERHLTAV